MSSDRHILFKRSATSPPQDGGVSALPILVFFSICAYTLCHRTTKFDAVTRKGKGLILGVIMGAVSQCSTMLGFLLFVHTPFVSELPHLTW